LTTFFYRRSFLFSFHRPQRWGSFIRSVFFVLFFWALVFFVFFTQSSLVWAGRKKGTQKNSGELTIRFFAAGHGDSTLVTTPQGHNILIDAGMGSWRKGDHLLERRLLPFFKKRGITRLDAFFVSHPHYDHLGDPRLLYRRVPFDRLFVNGDSAHFFNSRRISFRDKKKKRVPMVVLKRGDELRFGDVVFEVLHPFTKKRLSKRAWSIGSINNRSMVIRIRYGDVSFLLPGDLCWTGERRLLRAGPLGRVNVLKLGHHGQGSASEELIRELKPEYAVLSCCDRPWYEKIPRAVRSRLRRHNVKMLRTDKHNDIIFRTDGVRLHVREEMDFRMLSAGHCVWAMRRGLIQRYSCRMSQRRKNRRLTGLVKRKKRTKRGI